MKYYVLYQYVDCTMYTSKVYFCLFEYLFFQARVDQQCVGAIVCKLDYHKKVIKRGYIAMLAVDSNFRKRRIGSTLVKKAIDAMIAQEADEVSLHCIYTLYLLLIH